MRTAKSLFAVAHGRPRAHSLAQRQHPSRSLPARLEPSGFAAERRPHTCRIPTAIQWQTRRVKDRQPDDPGPCRRCASALSSAADAPAYISLGSHAKSGPPMRRSPRRAVPCGHRHGARRFAVGHGRHQPRSLAQRQHPSRSPHERLEPSAPCGRESNRERVGPTPTRRVRRRRATHRFIGSNRIWQSLPAALGASGPSFLQDVLESHVKPGMRMGGASGCGFLRFGMHVRHVT